MVKCLECGEEFSDRKFFHLHLKKHGLKTGDYYHRYFPRFDLVTGWPIEFENYEQYFTAFLNDIGKFWKAAQTEDKQKFVREFLLARKDIKGDKRALCQVELKTIKNAPTINHYLRAFGKNNYYDFCRSLGFISDFEDFKDLKINPLVLDDLSIQIDTREQRPFKFENKSTNREKLDFGDYKLFNQLGYEVFFERKSLSDLISTVTGGLDRFKNEIALARQRGKNLIVIIEASIYSLLNFKDLKWVYSKHKISQEYVCHNIRSIIQEFENLQFVFCNNRTAATTAMERIYSLCGKQYKIDLQLAFDRGLLT